MKVLYTQIDKQLIGKMPRVSFEGRIIVVQTEEEAERAVDYLLSKNLLGVDTETRPSFRKGQCNKVSLLQVSTEDTCFLFRLNRIGFPNCLVRMLGDERVIKVGLSLKDDSQALRRRAQFDWGAYVELQDYVKKIGICDMSLQKIYANVFGERISKSQRLSNWEADVLTDMQKKYAATDAWACIRIYNELERLRKNQGYELVEILHEAANVEGV